MLFLLFLLYLTPTWIAWLRGHPSLLAIFVVNMLTGWTVAGEFVALVWACTATQTVVIHKHENVDKTGLN